MSDERPRRFDPRIHSRVFTDNPDNDSFQQRGRVYTRLQGRTRHPPPQTTPFDPMPDEIDDLADVMNAHENDLTQLRGDLEVEGLEFVAHALQYMHRRNRLRRRVDYETAAQVIVDRMVEYDTDPMRIRLERMRGDVEATALEIRRIDGDIETEIEKLGELVEELKVADPAAYEALQRLVDLAAVVTNYPGRQCCIMLFGQVPEPVRQSLCDLVALYRKQSEELFEYQNLWDVIYGADQEDDTSEDALDEKIWPNTVQSHEFFGFEDKVNKGGYGYFDAEKLGFGFNIEDLRRLEANFEIRNLRYRTAVALLENQEAEAAAPGTVAAYVQNSHVWVPRGTYMWATAAEEWLFEHRPTFRAPDTPLTDYAHAVEMKLLGLRTDIVNGEGPGHGFRESQWDPEPGQEGWEEYEAAYYAAHPDAPRLDGDEDEDGMDGVEDSQDTEAVRSPLSQALHRLSDAHDAQDAGSVSTTTRLERSRNQRDFLAQHYERAEEARRTR